MEKYTELERNLDRQLLTDNTLLIKTRIHELLEEVESHPELYPSYLKKMMDVPMKFRVAVNGMSLHKGEPEYPSIRKWLIENNINLFDLLPVKSYALPKSKPFATSHEDKVFMGIHALFSYQLDQFGREQLLGSNFNPLGVVSTDTHSLLFTPYQTEQREFGNFCHTKKCFSHEEAVKNGRFPVWQSVVPTGSGRVEMNINAQSLNDCLLNMDRFGIMDHEAKSIWLRVDTLPKGGNIITISVQLLMKALDAMSRLGHKDLTINVGGIDVNTPILLYPQNRLEQVKDHTTDFALIMPILTVSNKPLPPGYVLYDLLENKAYLKEITRAYNYDNEPAATDAPKKAVVVDPIKVHPSVKVDRIQTRIKAFMILRDMAKTEEKKQQITKRINAFQILERQASR